MECLFSTLERLGSGQPRKPAIVEDGRTWSYGEFRQDVLRAQAWAEQQGIRPGDWIGLTVRAQYLHAVLAAALMRLGCCHVTLASFDAPQGRARLASQLPLQWHVTDDGQALLAGLRGRVLDGPGALAGVTQTDQPPSTDAGSPRVVLTTSGTTGQAKLIALNIARMHARYRHELEPESVLHMHATIEHNIVKNRLCKALFEGSTLVLARDLRFDALLALYRAHSVNELWLTPPVAAQLVQQCAAEGRDGPALPAARIALYGAKVEASLFHAVRARVGSAVTIRYGATETGPVTIADANCLASNPEAVGRPVPGITVQVVDDEYRAVPPGTPGRLGIRGEGVVGEYLFDSEMTRRHFRDGWFYSGDVAAIQEDGFVAFHGRADDMMILNGINIFPSEIEKVAAAFPGVRDCAAYPIASGRHGSIPALAVVGRESLDLDALAKHCRAQLGLRAPREVRLVDEIPRNAVGKVQRRLLKAGS